jgi:hypothetical protein
MNLSRRSFLKASLGALAAAVVAPEFVQAEGAKIWQLDRTMIAPPRATYTVMGTKTHQMSEFPPKLSFGDYQYNYPQIFEYSLAKIDDEILWCTGFDEHGEPQWARGQANTRDSGIITPERVSKIEILGVAEPDYGKYEIVNKRGELTVRGDYERWWTEPLAEEADEYELEILRGHESGGLPRRAGPDGLTDGLRGIRPHLRSGLGRLLPAVSGDGLPRDEAGDTVHG